MSPKSKSVEPPAAAPKRARSTAKSAPSVLTLSDLAGSRIRIRKNLPRTPSRNWKQNLEKNLINVGYTPEKARELVEYAAS
jgi:hypothetical protein